MRRSENGSLRYYYNAGISLYPARNTIESMDKLALVLPFLAVIGHSLFNSNLDAPCPAECECNLVIRDNGHGGPAACLGGRVQLRATSLVKGCCDLGTCPNDVCITTGAKWQFTNNCGCTITYYNPDSPDHGKVIAAGATATFECEAGVQFCNTTWSSYGELSCPGNPPTIQWWWSTIMDCANCDPTEPQ